MQLLVSKLVQAVEAVVDHFHEAESILQLFDVENVVLDDIRMHPCVEIYVVLSGKQRATAAPRLNSMLVFYLSLMALDCKSLELQSVLDRSIVRFSTEV